VLSERGIASADRGETVSIDHRTGGTHARRRFSNVQSIDSPSNSRSNCPWVTLGLDERNAAVVETIQIQRMIL
jgi:hypothetical protein